MMIPMEREEAERSEDGVDLTLIRWMMSMTPAERLESLREFLDSMSGIRGERD